MIILEARDTMSLFRVWIFKDKENLLYIKLSIQRPELRFIPLQAIKLTNN